jgi:hypothetical protein
VMRIPGAYRSVAMRCRTSTRLGLTTCVPVPLIPGVSACQMCSPSVMLSSAFSNDCCTFVSSHHSGFHSHATIPALVASKAVLSTRAITGRSAGWSSCGSNMSCDALKAEVDQGWCRWINGHVPMFCKSLHQVENSRRES